MRLKSCQVFFHRHQASELSSVLTALAARSFTGVSYNTFVPFSGTVLAHLGQARYPTWASTLPHLGTFAARMLPICPQYGRLRLGLNKILLVLVCDEPRVSVLPRMITHPNLPQGKGQVTLLCQRLQQINSANEHQPPPNLPRRGGTVTIAVDKRLII